MRSDQADEPIDRVRVVAEDRHLAAGNRHAERRMTLPQTTATSRGPFRACPPEASRPPAVSDSAGSNSSAYWPASCNRCKRQGPGQRPAVVEVVQPQQKRGLVAAAGVKEPPRDLGQRRHVARLQRVVQHPPGPGAVLQFVQLAALARHLADQPLCLGLQTAMDRRVLVGLKEEIFRLVQDVAQTADGLAEAAFGQQFSGIGQLLERAAVGRQEDVLGRGLVGRDLPAGRLRGTTDIAPALDLSPQPRPSAAASNATARQSPLSRTIRLPGFRAILSSRVPCACPPS